MVGAVWINAVPGGLGSDEQWCQVACSEDVCCLLMRIAWGAHPGRAGGFAASTGLCGSIESFVSWLFFPCFHTVEITMSKARGLKYLSQDRHCKKQHSFLLIKERLTQVRCEWCRAKTCSPAFPSRAARALKTRMCSHSRECSDVIYLFGWLHRWETKLPLEKTGQHLPWRLPRYTRAVQGRSGTDALCFLQTSLYFCSLSP